MPAATTSPKARSRQSSSNGEETQPSNGEIAAQLAGVTTEMGDLRNMLEEMATQPAPATKSTVKAATREVLEEETKGFFGRVWSGMKGAAKAQVPHSKKDVLHIGQGLAVGIPVGRLL